MHRWIYLDGEKESDEDGQCVYIYKHTSMEINQMDGISIYIIDG